MTSYKNSLAFAKQLDAVDPLKNFREHFIIPTIKGKKVIYLCGNSLGLQPKSAKNLIGQELKDWAELGVEGHFHAKNPWLYYHKSLTRSAAKIVGAKPIEVVMANTLTTNLHFLMVSFYRPSKKKFKIITEAGAFSSDLYALESQVKFHGLDPDKTIIELKPRDKEFNLRTEDIITSIEKNKEELALVILGGVNYYTGQAFDIKKITKAAHKANAIAGFDLAHAAGNIKLKLHDWHVDFAVWCTYKYLNAGPGSVGGLFVNQKYAFNKRIPRFAGWWGHNEKERFLMKKGFKPIVGAEGWQVSNAPVFSMALLKASLEIFEQAGINAIIKKSKNLTGFLEYLIYTECSNQQRKNRHKIKIITPKNALERGAQLSILIRNNGPQLFNKLKKEGFIVDWRSPNVIRVAPAPLYNTFEEVYKFSKTLSKTCYHE